MIKPVSFGSTYKIKNFNNGSNFEEQFAYDRLTDYCNKRRIPYNEKSFYNVKHFYGDTTVNTVTTIVAGDKRDSEIESICAARGIPFTKYNTKDLMAKDAILKRVKPAPKGYKTAMIDVSRFYSRMTKQEDANFHQARADYRKNKDEVQFILRSADPIQASTMNITTWYGDKKLENVIKTGIPEEDSLIISLTQQTDEPDHCMFIAMDNMGMKEIPVYMDDLSYDTADALGLIKH